VFEIRPYAALSGDERDWLKLPCREAVSRADRRTRADDLKAQAVVIGGSHPGLKEVPQGSRTFTIVACYACLMSPERTFISCSIQWSGDRSKAVMMGVLKRFRGMIA